VVFKLTPNGASWTYTVIYQFNGSPADGEDPADVLAIDGAGNIFGTTVYGGSGNGGTVYELSPAGDGSITEKVLYSFAGCNGNSQDGCLPYGAILDSKGNLFGITSFGGASVSYCAVWELSPDGAGGWTEQILHPFGSGKDGQYPRSALLLDASGNLFGTTSNGGLHGGGTAFELSPGAGGGWTESVIYNFGSRGDGCFPSARLISDPAGNLYGTTQSCASNNGTVFELSPSGDGYTEKIIHYFFGTSAGSNPIAPVVFDSAGNLYGTVYQGGRFNFGGVFKLTPNGRGGWTESPVHSFSGNADGAYPVYGVLIGTDGKVYGTAPYGGKASDSNGWGVIFGYNP
jgi:uncharacterized repeat protein (TIGR03803 family)